MNKIFVFITGILPIILIISCSQTEPKNKVKYCGIELSENEYNNLQYRINMQDAVYQADTIWNIYDQINDSIRTHMPDTLDFEIFMSLLTKDEVAIDVLIPDNEKYFDIIGCTLMNSEFKGKMPRQLYLCVYSYSKPDGSGFSPLEYAIRKL